MIGNAILEVKLELTEREVTEFIGKLSVSQDLAGRLVFAYFSNRSPPTIMRAIEQE
jgi:hypothetical protein